MSMCRLLVIVLATLSALSVSGVCGLNDERVVVVVEEEQVDDEALGDDDDDGDGDDDEKWVE